ISGTASAGCASSGNSSGASAWIDVCDSDGTSLVFLRRENSAISLSLTWGRGAGVPRGASELLDRGDLDEELLQPCRIEPHMRDALGAFSGDGVYSPLAEVIVADAVSCGELELSVVAHLACDLVGELVHRGRQRL